MGSCNIDDLVFCRWLFHRTYWHWRSIFKALTGIQEFPEWKLDFRISLNYRDMIEETRWPQGAEEGEVSSTSEIFVEREGKSRKLFLGPETEEEKQNCSL